MRFIQDLVPVLLSLIWASSALANGVAPLDLVVDTAAVCVEVQQPEAAFSKFQSSRLASRLRAFPPVKRLLEGGGFQKWVLLEEYVRRTTGKALSEQLLAACSESLVLAVYLPDGKPPEGVVIARAANAAALTQALQTWATLEPQQVSRSREYQGQTYVRRAKSASSAEAIYYVIFDRTIALSDQELRIQQMIESYAAADRRTDDGKVTRTIADLPLYQANRSQLPRDAVAFLFLNTRKWDKVIGDGLRQSRDAAWLLPIINRVSALSAALRLDDAVTLDVAADTRGADLPEAWRQFVNSTDGAGEWTNRVPGHAIVAVSSKMNVTSLIQLWLASIPEAKTEEFARGRNVLRSVLHGDPFTEILPRVARDWTVALIPAVEGSTDLSPVDLVGLFKLDEDPLLSQNLDQALQFGMTLLGAALSHQRAASAEPVIVESRSTKIGVERWMSGIRSFSPACLVTSGQLAVASSHRAIGTVTNSKMEEAAKTSRLATCQSQYFQNASQLAWIDLVQLRDVLARRGDWIASQLVAESKDDRQRIQRHLSRIEDIAKLFDAAFIAASLDEQGVRIVLGAALDRPE